MTLGAVAEIAIVLGTGHAFAVFRGSLGVLAITLPMIFAVLEDPPVGVLIALVGATGFILTSATPGLTNVNIALVMVTWTATTFIVAVVSGRLYRARSELLSRILTAEGEERRRIANDLHDDTIQEITAVCLLLDRAEVDAKRLPTFQRAIELLRTALERLRTLSFQLRPPTLEHGGLPSAIPDLCVEMRRRFAETNCQLVCEMVGVGRYAPAVEELAHRIVLEALQNAYRHAAARHVRVVVRQVALGVEVTVRDDGRGFDPGLLGQSHESRRHLGLASKLERVRWAGGSMDITSAPGKGTTIHAVLPAVRAAE